MSAIPKQNRQVVHDRDQVCFRCGIGNATDVHHRLRRREGGHGLENLILLCRACHAWVHAHPEEARDAGLIVSVAAQPEKIPARRWDGAWVLLDERGRYEFAFQ